MKKLINTLNHFYLIRLCFIFFVWATILCVTNSFAQPINVSDGDVAGLIAAINSANTNSGPDVINLAQGGTYTLTDVASTSYWTGPNGLPYITSQITVNGNGATIKRSAAPGTPEFRIICIQPNGDLTLNAVTITGGRSAQGKPGYYGGGGGLRNEGHLQLINSTVTSNDCFGVHSGNGTMDGGGIFNNGFPFGGGVLYVLNSTISYNTGVTGYGGGGITNHAGIVTIVNSTIFENFSYPNGGGNAIAQAYPISLTVKNSILASPTRGSGGDLLFYYNSPGLISLGHNIVSDASAVTYLTGPGDMSNTDPLLGPLADNGGPTFTHAPLIGSPVIDALPLAYCTDNNGIPITTDQRGILRPQGLACDIGSVELKICNQINVNLSSNPTIYVGYGAGNATLNVTNVTGGTPPYTYLWSTGGTSQSIVINPIVTTSYSVTVTDKNNCTGSGTVIVSVIDVRCGNKNDKVLVCHNGNELCISPNAVPAHLAHGDKLGHCGDNPEIVKGNLPVEFKLNPNYPNPFNPVTKISFDIPEQTFVTLKIYDALGREVKTLVNEIKAPGSYMVDFKGSELSSGVYFYRLSSAGFTDIKRMLLIK